jgi:hypothetical protein
MAFRASQPSIAWRRLRNQRLVGPAFSKPAAAVEWLCAVQSQDYAGAKWALALRTRGCSEAVVEQALQRGEILRTHVLRPTWHFVLPADLRWLQKLTAPRVHAASAYSYRKADLNGKTFARSAATIAKALQGRKHLTRTELAKLLERRGIPAQAERLSYLMMHAELEALICSGPRRGKQFTYALVDECAPASKPLLRDQALAQLALRYFASHGPALAQDFAWWSGLTVADAKLGIELAKHALESEVIQGKTYWQAPSRTTAASKAPLVHLLPNYDEHLIAYKDYSASFDEARVNKLRRSRDTLANHMIVSNGHVIGGWRRNLEKKAVVIEVRPLVTFERAERDGIQLAAERYGQFLGLPVRLVAD